MLRSRWPDQMGTCTRCNPQGRLLFVEAAQQTGSQDAGAGALVAPGDTIMVNARGAAGATESCPSRTG